MAKGKIPLEFAVFIKCATGITQDPDSVVYMHTISINDLEEEGETDEKVRT
jgi:hypothetical protein